LKRSNRLILLIGILLAAIVAVAVIMLLGNPDRNTNNPPGLDATYTTYTVAAVDIPLGTLITAEMVETKDVKITDKPAEAFTVASDAIGNTTTTIVLKGQNIGPQTFSTTTVDANIARLLGPGQRAMSVQVDQVSGVGTLVVPGDRVDVVLGITGPDKFPVVTIDPVTKQPASVAGLNNTSVKAVIQNLEVVGALLPPPPAQTGNEQGGTAAPTLNGQTQIVILSVTAQQAEALRWAQIDGSITLILRSPEDKAAPPVTTTGMTLAQLVDKWLVIPPQVVPITLPKK
jgi:pilus assembly protein CpaB